MVGFACVSGSCACPAGTVGCGTNSGFTMITTCIGPGQACGP
jgi:hypothetical protein